MSCSIKFIHNCSFSILKFFLIIFLAASVWSQEFGQHGMQAVYFYLLTTRSVHPSNKEM